MASLVAVFNVGSGTESKQYPGYRKAVLYATHGSVLFNICSTMIEDSAVPAAYHCEQNTKGMKSFLVSYFLLTSLMQRVSYYIFLIMIINLVYNYF